MTTRSFVAFDAVALYDALEYQRLERGLTWQGVANQVWDLSSVLNAQRGDHPLSVSTIKNLGLRRATSCQHALFLLRWLDRTPESFLKGGVAAPASKQRRTTSLESPSTLRGAQRDKEGRGDHVATTRQGVALHTTPTHRTTYRQVRHRHGPRNVHRPVARTPCVRFHRRRDVVTFLPTCAWFAMRHDASQRHVVALRRRQLRHQ